MRTLRLALFLGLCASAAHAFDVAVSIRYLAPKGVSHAAILLFDGKGKLVRQLTHPGGDQDYAPAFSPDGKVVHFPRVHEGEETNRLFVVGRDGKETRAVAGEPPEWFMQRTMATAFGDTDSFTDEPDKGEPVRTLASPDGSLALVLKPNPADDEGHALGKFGGASLFTAGEPPLSVPYVGLTN